MKRCSHLCMLSVKRRAESENKAKSYDNFARTLKLGNEHFCAFLLMTRFFCVRSTRALDCNQELKISCARVNIS